ncbi:YgjV family protein [Xylanimonas protaetiae]|uniref:YgjV family protein n=1 Tax=Xylanimonas protaetiae TaxID=2509457 RepID=UPI0013EBBFA2|nr:YgjV family protein [Xylanimonas protaetiae]
MDSFLGMPLEVGMDRFVLAQVFGLLTLLFNFWSYQKEDQRQYFGLFTIGSVFWLAMYIAIGAQLPVMLVAIFSTLRGIVFYWALGQDTPFARMLARRTLYTTMAIAFTASVAVIPSMRPETIPLQVFLAISVLFFVVGQYMPGVYLVRIFAVVYALAVLLLNTPLDTFNPMGIIIELNNMAAVAVFFFFFARRRRESRRLAAIPPKALSLGTPAPGAPALV